MGWWCARQAVFDVDEGALLAGSIYTSFEA